jgi:putative nucleotidyltransferase with HDIG domain
VKQIDDFITSADFLPPSFQLLPKLILLLEDVESNADALADLIRVDAGLTADILRVGNSAVYAQAYRAENIQQAILRIGFKEVHRVLMGVIASPVLNDPQSAYAQKGADLWNHSLAAAVSSEFVASPAGIDTDLAFTAALVHDIGKVVLSHAVPKQTAEAQTAATERNQPLYLAERTILKTDHAAVGGRLLDRWGFPKNISIAVKNHHEPALAKNEIRLASCVCLSNVLAYRVQNTILHPEYALKPDANALKELKLTEPELEAIIPEATERFAAAQARFM